jgi:hypothetical protein
VLPDPRIGKKRFRDPRPDHFLSKWSIMQPTYGISMSNEGGRTQRPVHNQNCIFEQIERNPSQNPMDSTLCTHDFRTHALQSAQGLSRPLKIETETMYCNGSKMPRRRAPHGRKPAGHQPSSWTQSENTSQYSKIHHKKTKTQPNNCGVPKNRMSTKTYISGFLLCSGYSVSL